MRPLLALVLAALPLFAAPARAEPKADVRLLVGDVVDGKVEAGIAIDLPAGWKTYWRTPGDAGIPPSIETAGSGGFDAIAVRFPAPVRFEEAGLTAIGYTRSVVLPVEARLADPAKPGRLVVQVMLGLCRDVCLPFEAKLETTVDPASRGDPVAAAAIAAALERVPVPAVAGEAPSVSSVVRSTVSGRTRLVAEVRMPAETTAGDVFVEGPTPEWALPQPEKIDGADGREHWAFDLDGVPKDVDLAGVALRFTVVAGERAVDQIVRVDARPSAP